jgi:hypothetical protein
MMKKRRNRNVAAVVLVLLCSCAPRDQMAMFVKQMDNAPPSERPPNWDEVKRLMARPAPAVGTVAPEFSLPSVDGTQSLTMSRQRGDKPLVLIFGSFT